MKDRDRALVTPHALRRSYITIGLLQGVPLRDAAACAAHEGRHDRRLAEALRTNDRYGLGVGLEGDVLGHDGRTIGYSSFVRYHQPDDTMVVVLRNALAEGERPPAGRP